jgi:hypothetical protein
MAKAYKNKQEQEALILRPVYSSAQVYYTDFNTEKRSKKFTYKAHDFNFICKATNSTIPITRKEQDLLANISNMLKSSPSGSVYLSHAELSNLTGNNKRQNNVMRKNLSHILRSKWKKKIKIDGTVMNKVIIFKYTTDGEVILNNPRGYYGKIKAGIGVPISIYKDENIYIKDRSSVQEHKSSFCENSKKEVTKKVVLANACKKPTNQERKARIYSPKFKQYDKPKSLGAHYPLTTEECSELQSRSGREFTLNAMNEILLDMSRKPKLQGHSFVSKARFMAYMATVYRYEGRDAVKTANSAFKLLTRATEAEIIQHTTQAERESYLNLVEQQAIMHRSDETQYKAKLVGSLNPSQAYNFLSSLRTVRRVGEILELHMSQDVLFTDYSLERILSDANAVGGYCGVEKLEIIVKTIKNQVKYNDTMLKSYHHTMVS